MSFYDAIRIGASGAGDYEVERSLRFNDNDTAYLSRNFQSGGNRKKWTFSAWIKRSNLGGAAGEMRIFGGSTNASHIFITSNDSLTWDVAAPGSSASANLTTTQKFRDVSAWFHLVCAFDTDNSTANNRMRIYINGTEVTSFGTRTNPSSGYAANAINADAFADGDRSLHTIGYRTSVQGSAGMEFDGYMAEINFIDGQQYDPSYFGETDAITGQWNPKKYVGGYGTTGFYLNFSDNSGTTATTLGKDSSGNGNNFTPNNFSVAAGAGNDSVEDTPTNNFPTFNPLCENNDHTYLEGNLKVTHFANNQSGSTTSMATPRTGKWYWEVRALDSFLFIGVTADTYLGTGNVISATNTGGSTVAYYNDGQKYVGGSASGYGASFANGDLIGVAVDMDNGQVTFYKNNASQGAISLISTRGHIGVGAVGTGQNLSMSINFGQQSFTYTPPTGFKKLCSANLPDPTILLPNQHFNTLLYTGNDSNSRDITGVGFQPDWLWIKNRSQADFHQLVDAVRGANKTIYSNDTDNEQTDNANGHVNSFLADGFNVDAGGSGNVNENNENYVAWNWNAGNSDGATYRVVVVSDSGNKYRFRNSANTTTFAQSAVTLNLAEGGTYIFNMDDSTNASHPFSIGTAANGTVYTSGITYFLDGVSKTYSQYTSGFASATTRRLHITVPASAPVLYYWCSAHSGMGGAINTNSTLGSTNFDGTSLAVVKANTTAGFSIVTYTGTGSSTTVGHGLGIAPKVVLTRSRSSGGSWGVLHTESNPTAEHRINLNDNGGFSSYQGYNIWADTVPTSSVFTVNSDATTNASSVTYVGYLFNEVAGYSKFGKYTGNGDANGPFIFTGFRPAWIMIKNVNTSTWWFIYDVKRETFNPQRTIFGANVADAEYPDNAYRIDILSNGFKIRGTQNETNKSGDTISYFSFAESPFKNSRAR